MVTLKLSQRVFWGVRPPPQARVCVHRSEDPIDADNK